MITISQLKTIVPAINPGKLQQVTDLLNEFMPKYEITTTERICAFIANIAHESGSFRYTEEIASGAAYEGRKDLGNTEKGDGIKFKGRGWIQLTGRSMYLWCSKELHGDDRFINNPELLEQYPDAAESACWFWKVAKNLNTICDMPDNWTRARKQKNDTLKTYTRFEWVCFLINGGENGWAERKEFYSRAIAVIK